MPRDNFAVRQHLKYVELYSTEANYQTLTYEDTLIVREEVAPLDFAGRRRSQCGSI